MVRVRVRCRSWRCSARASLIEADETETDAYLRISAMRYRALRTHEWSDEVLEELRRGEQRRKRRRRPPPDRSRRRKI